MDYYKNADKIFTSEENLPPLEGLQYNRVPEVPKAATAIDLSLLKAHARIDFDTDDTLLQLYLEAAIDYLEKWSQRSLQPRIWRVRALRMPPNFRLAYGPIEAIVTTGYTNFGDKLVEGGTDVDVTYTSLGIGNQPAVQVAIAKYATGLYIHRENIIETKFSADSLFQSALEMLAPYKMVTLL